MGRSAISMGGGGAVEIPSPSVARRCIRPTCRYKKIMIYKSLWMDKQILCGVYQYTFMPPAARALRLGVSSRRSEDWYPMSAWPMSSTKKKNTFGLLFREPPLSPPGLPSSTVFPSPKFSKVPETPDRFESYDMSGTVCSM